DRMLGMFETAMSEYAHLGRSIQTALADQTTQPVASLPKVGRNEPCHCGSGKKYKKCCLH
ncbi:MAG: SEC-C metal-binding domain-containing protein, partial [Thiohalomonadales bacterium]